MMVQVKQQDEWGCGVACVAMVANVNYEEAKVKVHGKRDVRRTWTCDLISALAQFNIPVGKRLLPFRNRNYRRLKIPAIMKVNLLQSGHWHWVVWDISEKAVRNPLEGPADWRTTRHRYRCSFYLPVIDLEGPHF